MSYIITQAELEHLDAIELRALYHRIVTDISHRNLDDFPLAKITLQNILRVLARKQALKYKPSVLLKSKLINLCLSFRAVQVLISDVINNITALVIPCSGYYLTIMTGVHLSLRPWSSRSYDLCASRQYVPRQSTLGASEHHLF